MATSSGSRAVCAVVATAADTEKTAAVLAAAAVSGKEAASGDAGDRATPANSRAPVAGHQTARFGTSAGRTNTGGESRGQQKQLSTLYASESGCGGVAAEPPSGATATEGGGAETPEAAATLWGRGNVCNTPPRAATAARTAGDGSVALHAVRTAAAAVSAEKNTAAEAEAGGMVGCSRYCGTGGALRTGPGATGGSAGHAAATKKKAHAAAAAEDAGQTCKGGAEAAEAAAAAADPDTFGKRRGPGTASTAAAAATKGEDNRKRCVYTIGLPRMKRMTDGDPAAENIRGAWALSCKRSRSYSVTSRCHGCCCWGGEQSGEEAASVLRACRLLQLRHAGPRQPQQRKCGRHQQRERRSSCFFHSLFFSHEVLHSKSIGLPHRWKVAAYAASLLLAFTCGEMYGRHTTASECCSSWTCAPSVCCPSLTATQRRDPRTFAKDQTSPLAEDATAAAPGAADTSGPAGAAAQATVATTAAAKTSTVGTNQRDVAATSEREEVARAAAVAGAPAAEEIGVLKSYYDERGAQRREEEDVGMTAAAGVVWTTRSAWSNLSEAATSLATVPRDSSSSCEGCGSSTSRSSSSNSSGSQRRGNSSSSRSHSNISERSSRRIFGRDSLHGNTASERSRGNPLSSDGPNTDPPCSSCQSAGRCCTMSRASSSGSSLDDGSGCGSNCWRPPASSSTGSLNIPVSDEEKWRISSNHDSSKENSAFDSSSSGGGSGVWDAALRQGVAFENIRFADLSALLDSPAYWSAATAAPHPRIAAAVADGEVEDDEEDDEGLEEEQVTAGKSSAGAQRESKADLLSASYGNLEPPPTTQQPQQREGGLPSNGQQQHHHHQQQQQPVRLQQDDAKPQQQHIRQPHSMRQQRRGMSQQQLSLRSAWNAQRNAEVGSVTLQQLVMPLSFEAAASSGSAVAGVYTSEYPSRVTPSLSLFAGTAASTSLEDVAPRAAAVVPFAGPVPSSSSSLFAAPAAEAPADVSLSSAAAAAASVPATLLRVPAAAAAAAASVVHVRRLLDAPYPGMLPKSEKGNGESPRLRGEHPPAGAATREDLPKKRLEAKIKKRLAAAAPGAATSTAAAPQEKKKDASPRKRSATPDKTRRGSSRQEAAGPPAQSPARQHRPPHLRLLDPHIFRKELCPFLRTGDTQLKSWFALLVLYIAEWPAYAYTGNGGRRFIEQLRYYAENFRPPLTATEHGKKLFDDELACGTTEVFKEGLAALKDRIHNFGDMTRVLKHLAKTERDFADLLDYTQYSKLPARAAVTGFALLLRTAFEGMVFSFCKSVFLRKGFKGNFNRKELYSNVVWLYHRTQTQYWMLLLVGKIIKQIASGRPHTGIVILRSEENPRFRAVGESSSFFSSTAYGTDSKGQMLEVLYGVGAYSALQRIVSGTIRKKVGWALSRFEELASEKGERSSAKGVLQPHVFVTGYYGKTSRGTEVREGLFGSEVEADALEEMMEDLPAGHVLLQISLVDEWIFRDPADWTRLHKSEADVLTAYTAVQMLRAELSWDPSLGSLGSFSVAYTGVTDLYSRQRTTAEERRYDPDVHVLLMDDATRFVQTASEEGCRSRILSIVSEDPLQLRRSVPASRISIRGTAKLLPSGELFRKGSFGMGLSLELQRSAEKRLRLGQIMIHLYVRGLNRRSPDTDDLDFTASELVSRLLQRSEGYYDIPVVKMVTPITSQSLIPRGVVTSCAHTVPDWVVVVSSCSIAVFFLAMIILLMYHEKLKLPWWLHCFCSSSSPWSMVEEAPTRDSPVEIPGEYGKSPRKAFSKSSKQTQAHLPFGADAGGSAAAAGALAHAPEGGPAGARAPEGDEPEGSDEETTALERSSIPSSAGSREAEEARGWLPAATKWVGDRSLSTSSQRLKNHVVMGSTTGKKNMRQQRRTIGSDDEDEESSILQANGRSPSRQLAAFGSASTSASTCAHPGFPHNPSIESSNWEKPFTSPGSAVLSLQHQQQQSPFSRSDSERGRDRTHAGVADKESGLNTSRASSFCAHATHSSFPYVTSSTYPCSEWLPTAGFSQQHVASTYSPAHLPQQDELHAGDAAPPAKDFFKHSVSLSSNAACVRTTLRGKHHNRATTDEAASQPRSHTDKQVSVNACEAGPFTQRSVLESSSVPSPQQLQLPNTAYTPSGDSNDASSSTFLQCHNSASHAPTGSRGIQIGASRFLSPEEGSHGSGSDESLHEFEEFD